MVSVSLSIDFDVVCAHSLNNHTQLSLTLGTNKYKQIVTIRVHSSNLVANLV